MRPRFAPSAGPLALVGLGTILLALAGCDAVDPTATIVATGTVTNSFGRPVAGATVSFDARDEGASTYATATANAEGWFRAEVPPGTYTVVTAAEGYNSAGRTLTLTDSAAALTQTLSGPGTLVAQFVSALTGQGAPGLALRCARRLADDAYPNPATAYDFSATSDTEGRLRVAGAPAGALRCRAEGPDFDPSLFDITIRRDGPTEFPQLVITPPPPEGALRIVLTWGRTPNDLDAHLTGPDGAGGRFHLYFGAPTFGPSLLDVDDISSYGPETITVFPHAVGTYRYSVHNWSDQSLSGSQGIAASPARVEVHDHRGLVCTYRPPRDAQPGNTWRVFEAEAHGAGGPVVFSAPCTRGQADLPGLGYVLATEADDLGAFLTSGPPKGTGH